MVSYDRFGEKQEKLTKNVQHRKRSRKQERKDIKEETARTSLVAQGLRIRPAMQGTQVRSPAREDPTFRGATQPRRRSH